MKLKTLKLKKAKTMQDKILVQLTRIADALEQLSPLLVVNPVTEEDLQASEEVKKEPESKPLTHEDLKSALLAKSRENIDNKPKLKALLKKYDASKAVDVPKDKLSEIIEIIEKGEF